jgi:hypothetical protein
MPREDRFVSLFEPYATLVVATAESLRAALAGGPALHQQLQAVVDRESEADAITREVIRGGSGNLHRRDEWSFCLTAARMAAEQERR